MSISTRHPLCRLVGGDWAAYCRPDSMILNLGLQAHTHVLRYCCVLLHNLLVRAVGGGLGFRSRSIVDESLACLTQTASSTPF